MERRLLLFQVDGVRAAVAESAVVEIVAAVALRRLPHQPDYVGGIFELRGSVVPAIDVRVRFGFARRPMELSDRLVVVRAAGRLVALWVDGVDGFADVAPEAWSPLDALVARERSLSGVATVPDGLVAIHDPGAFVAQCEADAVFEAAGA